MDSTNSKVPNIRLRSERELRGWSQSKVAKEIGTNTDRISRWECGDSTVSPYYREKLCTLFGKNARELGFLDEASDDDPQEEPPELVGISEEPSPTQPTSNINLDGHQPVQIFVPNGPHIVTVQIYQQPAIPTDMHPGKNGIIDTRTTNTLGQERPGEIGSIVKRREFFQEGLHAGAVILTSYDLVNNELLDRFLRALKKPATIDERTLNYFELRTEGYWQDRHSAALPSDDLLSYVIEHFQKVITLLEGSLFPSVRTRLCCIASGIAQLAGHLLFDMTEFARARNFHQIAIIAAQEGDNQALEAVAWGRMSFTWTYGGNPLEALRCIQEARCLAEGNVNATVRAYLAAVEAEIQAILGSSESCLKALEIAERVEDRHYPKE